MRVGYLAPTPLLAPAELADMAVLAEDLGFDSVFAPDHFQPWRQVGHAPAVVPWLTFVGARTRRICLGISSCAATSRRNPAITAQEFATLGCLFPQRVILTLGMGERHDEAAITGAVSATRDRLAMLRESVTIVGRLWRGERVTFHGEHFRTEDAVLHDLPAEKIPLLVHAAITGEAAIAGELADGMVASSISSLKHHGDELIPSMQRAAKHRLSRELTLEVNISYDHNPKRAAKSARMWAPTQVLEPLRPVRNAADVTQLSAHAMPTRWLVGSTPEDVLPTLQSFAALGYSNMVFSSPSNDQERFLRSFSEDILPALHSLDGAAAAG